jgi:hypothetical protein
MKVGWKTMLKDVEDWCISCHECHLVASSTPTEPMQRSLLPQGPWEAISMDFLGPLACGVSLLIVVDLYSGCFEVEAMRSITADKLLAKLRPMFVRFGLHNSVLTDNGQAYKDKGFNNFGKWDHRIPNKNLMKRLQLAAVSGKDWLDKIVTYFANCRVTPHSVTVVPPAELFYGRKVRSRVPGLQVCISKVESRD